MKKMEMIKAVKDRLNAYEEGKKAPHKFTNENVREIFEALQEVILEGAMDEEGITIIDGLKIGTKQVEEREARNPQNGDVVIVPAHLKPYAKFGKTFKTAINE